MFLIRWLKIIIVSFSRTKAEQDEFAKVNLRDLSIIKTLGVGGFGRVELVSAYFSGFQMCSCYCFKRIRVN